MNNEIMKCINKARVKLAVILEKVQVCVLL